LSNGISDSLGLDVEAGKECGYVHVDMAIKGKFELDALDFGGTVNSYDNNLA
jgi:hypothetical protein